MIAWDRRMRAACSAGQRRCAPAAFTMIELMVVVMILGLLIAILLPAVGAAVEETRRIQCLSNLRQMAIAAFRYAEANDGFFPVAYYNRTEGPKVTSYAWDFTTTVDWSAGGKTTVSPGLLWGSINPDAVMQCPSYKGPSNWGKDPFTGYNYNTSYVGRGEREGSIVPARIEEVRNPQRCALFGDGGYSGGANKFMRSPWESPTDVAFPGRHAGTQAFRHNGKANVVFADGHGRSFSTAFRETYPHFVGQIAPGTGFISPDNSLYDLE